MASICGQSVPQEVDKGDELLFHSSDIFIDGAGAGKTADALSQLWMIPPKGMKLCQAIQNFFAIWLRRGKRPLRLKVGFRQVSEQYMRFASVRRVRSIVARRTRRIIHRHRDNVVILAFFFTETCRDF